MSKKLHMDIDGMTCISCQTKIEKALSSVKGVTKAKVNYSQGTADVEYDENKTDEKKLIQAVEKLDYKVISSGGKANQGGLNTWGILVIIAALYYLIQSLGLLNHLVPGKLADSSMGYGMLFLIGILTSVHCIAMCGGIGISQAIPKKDGRETFLPNLLYNLGRVCSYTTIGFVFGLIGSVIGGGAPVGVPVSIQGILKIVAGLFMVIMGINMLGIFPGLRKLTIHTPASVARIIDEKRKTAKGPFVIGLFNGLMPCGPLQAMWIVAFATASPVAGALSMFMFSLGTVPLMLGLGSVVSILGKKFTRQVMKVGAILVVVLGLSMLRQGVALGAMQPVVGNDCDVVVAKDTTETTEEVIENNTGAKAEELPQGDENMQIVNSTLERGTYPEITVQAGVPVRWVIDAPEGNINGCNAVMIINDYGIQHAFEAGENIIEFTPEKSGVVNYSCWMGMIYGKINVVDQ
ncbi:MAG: sulfite exporter TauE/SafE family protein [Butyrivibrio sp.]|nr:sulfite exporter TauE/SafE family protein [Butyrivibrio sp.]